MKTAIALPDDLYGLLGVGQLGQPGAQRVH
jgi:hypothetical protein